MTELNDLKTGSRVRGLVAAADVTVIAVEPHGDGIVNVVYRGDDGQISDRLLTAEQAAGISVTSGRRWMFDADGAAFKLASEARRIELAHLFDPFAAVGSSTIQPLPHQIDAVYGRLAEDGSRGEVDEMQKEDVGRLCLDVVGLEHVGREVAEVLGDDDL